MLTNDNKSVAASETRHLFGLQSTNSAWLCHQHAALRALVPYHSGVSSTGMRRQASSAVAIWPSSPTSSSPAPLTASVRRWRNLARHLDFQDKLERDDVMFAAGPHWTDDEQRWDGEGMALSEIRRIAVSGRVHREREASGCD
jgi:hypothetical protein